MGAGKNDRSALYQDEVCVSCIPSRVYRVPHFFDAGHWVASNFMGMTLGWREMVMLFVAVYSSLVVI